MKQAFMALWLFLFTCLSVGTFAQTGRGKLTAAEFFFDTDPGPGSGTALSLQGGINDALRNALATATASLSPGNHKLHVRFRDSLNQWGPVFRTVISVESPLTYARPLQVSFARFYWDNQISGAIGLIILNGNLTDPINTFINTSPITTFSAPGLHILNIQVMDAGGTYGPAFKSTLMVEAPIAGTRIISAALGRAFWDANLSTAIGMIILNGNASQSVNDFIQASPPSTFSQSGSHILSVQLAEPGSVNVYSPEFKTVVHFEDSLQDVPTVRVDEARIWLDNNIGTAISMLAFDGNFNEPLESALQALPAPGIGTHTLHIQVRDSLPSHWGPVFKTAFVVEGPLSYRNIHVASGQLYWDNDTLNQVQTLIAFDGAYDDAIEQALLTNIAVPASGLHHLCARFKDVAGNWSQAFRLVVKVEDSLFARNIRLTQGEVRIDNTPPISIIALNGNYAQALEQAQSTLLSSGVPVGLHRLLVRFKGLEGNWGPYFITAIVVSPCASTPAPAISWSRPLEFCYGDSTVLTATAGFNSYQWVLNNTVVGYGQQLVARDSGLYTVIVTDNTDCPGSSIPLHVNVHHPQVQISGNNPFCQGTTNVLTANAGYTSYVWSAGSTTYQQSTTLPGTYTVQVTDAYGCTATDLFVSSMIPQPQQPVITASGSLALCPGSQVILTADVSQNIVWNTGATSQSILVDTAGVFQVTVTGANGCQSTSAVVQTSLLSKPAATIQALGSTTICDGQSVTLQAGGGSSYLWSNGATGSAIAAGQSALYSAIVYNTQGCSDTTDPVQVIVNPNPPVPVITANGPLSFCNGLSVTLTSNASQGNLWNSGQQTQQILITSSGNYIDTVVNSFGCKSWSLPVVVDVHPTASITASGPTVFCAGESVTLTANPSTGVTYNWSNGIQTASQTIHTTQSLSVIVEETVGGCRDTAFVNVVVHPLPTGNLVATGPTTFCSGSMVNLLASSTPHTRLRWFINGSPIVYYSYFSYCSCFLPIYSYGPAFNASVSGNYSVEIYDSTTGCIGFTNTVSVNVLTPVQPLITANGGTTLCIGANTQLSSTPAVFYLWNTGDTTQHINAATAGTYQVTITDSNGCSSTSLPTPVTFYPNATISSSGPTTFCFGSSVNLTAHPSGTYQWSNGSTNAQLNGLNAGGTYYVTVTDVNGCTNTSAPVTLVVNPLPAGTISASSPTTVCSGNQATFSTNGSANCIYRWYRNGSPIVYYVYNVFCSCYIPVYTYGYTFSTLLDGMYSAEIIDTLTGCSSMTNSIPVTVLSLPTPTAQQTAFINCHGAQQAALSVSGSGTIAPYSYLWSNGSSSQLIQNLGAGTYSVTVTDGNGCSNQTSYTINQPAPLQVVASSPANTRGYHVSCFGSTDGTATAYPSGGTAPYTYTWNTGSQAAQISNLGAGTYTVIVNDANLCGTATATVTLIQPQPITLTLAPNLFYGGHAISCAGGSNGSVVAQTSGGTANFTYAWNNGQTSQIASGLSAGNYTVIATDSVGCSASANITLTSPTPLSHQFTTSDYGGYGVSCFGTSDGSIQLTVSGGTFPYVYYWADTAYTANRQQLAAGMYYVTVSDTLGCSFQDSIELTEPFEIISTTQGSMLNCYGDSNGTATVHVTGGQAPYTYLWENGQTDTLSTQLSAGNYLVTVTDARACTHVNQALVQQPPQVVAYAFGTYVGCGTQIGLLSVSGTGGHPPYSYLWNNGSTSSFQTNQPLGTYTVTLTDSHGCWDTAEAIILSPPPLSATVTPYQTICDSLTTIPAAHLEVNVSGGVTPYMYLWSNGATTSSIQNLPSAQYSVVVTDANGCTVAPTALATNNDPATILGDSTLCDGGLPGSLYSPPALSYQWYGNSGLLSTAQQLNNVTAGSYTLQVVNLNGCTHDTSITVVSQQCEAILDLKLYLQSYYHQNGFMVPVLMNQNVGFDPTLTDTILVELHQPVSPYSIVASKKVILKTDGTTTCVFPPVNGHYYIGIRHRNALQTWSHDSVAIGPVPTYYDFSSGASQAYADNQVEMEPGVWALYSGDVNYDDNLDLLDINVLEVDIADFAFGYIASDLNGDGNADLLDTATLEENIANYIFSIYPN